MTKVSGVIGGRRVGGREPGTAGAEGQLQARVTLLQPVLLGWCRLAGLDPSGVEGKK